MDTLFSLSLILFLCSFLFLFLVLISPKKFLFILSPPARNRKKGLICGIYLIFFTFFLASFFVPIKDKTAGLIISTTGFIIFSFLLYRQIVKSKISAILEETLPTPADKQTAVETIEAKNIATEIVTTVEPIQQTENKSGFFSQIKSNIITAYNDWQYTQEGKKEYETLFKEVLEDDTISDDEKEKLFKLAAKYKLSENDLSSIHKNLYKYYIKKIENDQRVTDQELSTLNNLVIMTGQENRELDRADEFKISKYYTLWKIEEENFLPQSSWDEINVIPKKNEILHWVQSANLNKIKNVTRRVNYGGPVASIKICKGLSYRVGSLGVSTERHEELNIIDSGTFWITNQRIGFIGDKKSFTMALKKVLSFEVSPEYGLVIHKEGTVNPQMVELQDYDIACTIISQLINNLD